jgi:hypothetical protein
VKTVGPSWVKTMDQYSPKDDTVLRLVWAALTRPRGQDGSEQAEATAGKIWWQEA